MTFWRQRVDTQSVKVNPQRFPLFHQTVQGYDMCRTRILFCSFFEDSLVWHKSRGNCVTKLGRKKTFQICLLSEMGYRNYRSVSATVALFHDIVREYEMCRHRILFCFLLEDSLVTPFLREWCHEVGWGNIFRIMFEDREGIQKMQKCIHNGTLGSWYI